MRRPRCRTLQSLLLAVLLVPSASVSAFAKAADGQGPGNRVVGVVVDEKGKPVADARIELTRTPGGFPSSCGCSQDPEIYRARTGPAGRFEARGLPASWFELRIDHPDFAPLTRNAVVVPDAAGAVDLGRLTLGKGRKLDGIVVDGEGRPLANTAIWIRGSDPRPEGYAFLQRGPRRVTGADGRFSIPIEKKETLDLYACRRDRSRFMQRLDDLAQPLRIVLPSSGRIPGRIVDPEGHPVPGARVSAGMYLGPPSCLIDEYDPCPQTDSNASSVTDAEGRFVLEPIRQGVFGVWVSADDFLPYTRQEVELGGSSGLRSLDIVLRWGAASLVGQVRTGTGVPVPGVDIFLSCQEGQSRTSTGPDGRYRLGSLNPGGTCHLLASGDRFNNVEDTVAIKDGENHLDLQLVPTATLEIRGRVIGPASEPVAGAEVEIRSALGDRKHLTAADGSFAVETVAGSRDCGISVWKDGYAAYRLQNVDCGEAPAKEAVIHLERALTLTGRILHLDPEQLRSVQISAINESFSHPRASVSPDGTYRIVDLGPGEWNVSVVAGRRFVDEKVTLQRGQENATLDLSFGEQFPVRGRVFGPDGEGIAGATLGFAGAESFSDQARTQGDGSFEILLENGSYTVEVSALYGPSTSTEANWSINLPPITVAGAPLEGVDVHLKKGTALHGCIPGLLPDEHPMVQASHQGTTWSYTVQEDGCYRFESLEPGDWSVTTSITASITPGPHIGYLAFRIGDGRRIQSHITVAPGAAETVLDLDLGLGDRTLTIRPAGVEKPGELRLRLLFPSGTLVEDAGQGADGAFRISRLRAGNYRIQILDAKNQILMKGSVELTSDREVVVETPGQGDQ
jgi:protocatechuate 3,4-dioxygenase beta subunit